MRTHSPENPELDCSREPSGGASKPALAWQIISSPTDKAMILGENAARLLKLH